MNRKSLFAAIALATTAGAVSAQDYNVEVGASIINSDLVDGVNLYGQYHFNTVDTSNKPLGEAAFLTRSNNIQLTYTDQDIEDFFGAETTAITINGEFYLGEMFYVAPGYVTSETDTIFGSTDFDSVFVSLGVTPVEGMRISTLWFEEGDYDLNLNFKYVTQLAGGNYINFIADYADAGDVGDDTVSVGADYYIDNTLSVGGSVINEADTNIELRAKKFFTPIFSAGIRYLNADSNDVISIEGAVRF